MLADTAPAPTPRAIPALAVGDRHRWANNVVGSGTGQQPAPRIVWRLVDLNVHLDNGKIDFVVRGLVLAGGNSIGTPGAVLQVKGTLVCDTDGSASGLNSVVVNTPLVDLDDQGDAQFNGSVGPLPSVCASEPDVAFLIRVGSGVGSGRWIANGTVLR